MWFKSASPLPLAAAAAAQRVCVAAGVSLGLRREMRTVSSIFAGFSRKKALSTVKMSPLSLVLSTSTPWCAASSSIWYLVSV